MTAHNPKMFNPPKKNKSLKRGVDAWLGNFQPHWQNCKIAMSPTTKTGSTPISDKIIEPHS